MPILETLWNPRHLRLSRECLSSRTNVLYDSHNAGDGTGHLVPANSDAPGGAMMPPQPQTQAPAAAPVAPPVPVKCVPCLCINPSVLALAEASVSQDSRSIEPAGSLMLCVKSDRTHSKAPSPLGSGPSRVCVPWDGHHTFMTACAPMPGHQEQQLSTAFRLGSPLCSGPGRARAAPAAARSPSHPRSNHSFPFPSKCWCFVHFCA